MNYVYVLTEQAEGGSYATATADRGKLSLLLRERWPTAGKEWLEEAEDNLRDLLKDTDETLATGFPLKLHKEWGGALLYVLELQ